ncbi:MAG TPA: response regulator transcription factor [Xanthobacteraceae bacterium]
MRPRSLGTVLVRPNAVLHEDLARVLVATDFRTVASTTRVHDPEQITLTQDPPTLLIVDAGDGRAIAQIELLKKRYPLAHIAVLADHYRRSDLVSAYRAGANACFVKAMSCDAFFKALGLIKLGETILPPELLPFIDDHEDHHEHPPTALDAAMSGDLLPPLGIDPVPRLSAREKCILRCVVEGDSNKTIARKICIAEATVKVHVKAILRKLRLSNRTQAAIWAMHNSSLVWSTDEQPSAETMAVPPPLAPDEPNGLARAGASMNLGNGSNSVTLAGPDVIVRKGAGRKFE